MMRRLICIVAGGLLMSGPFSQAEIVLSPLPVVLSLSIDPELDGEAELISVAFEDASIETVVSVYAKWSGANIIADPAMLQGRVTVDVEDVHWYRSLNAILGTHGLMVEEFVEGSRLYNVVWDPTFVRPYEPNATQLMWSIAPRVPQKLYLVWLIGVWVTHPLFAIAVFRVLRRRPVESRPVGRPLLWAYLVVLLGLPGVALVWWVHRELVVDVPPSREAPAVAKAMADFVGDG